MECEVCMREFDEDDRRPKVLTCGHTLCWACIKATKRCHKDRMDVLNVDELVDNFYVLGLLDKPYNSLGGRFYCLTCKKPAVSACLDEHDICSLKKVRQGQVTPHLESVRTGVELQRRIVNRLVTLIPVLADTFNRLVEAATEKQDALQHTLDRVSGVLETSGLEESWQDASVTLEEAAKRCEEQRPDLERVLDILESRGKCYLELALQPQGDGQNALSAASETDLAEDTEVTRAVRFVLFLLNSSGNLVEHEAEQQTPADDTQCTPSSSSPQQGPTRSRPGLEGDGVEDDNVDPEEPSADPAAPSSGLLQWLSQCGRDLITFFVLRGLHSEHSPSSDEDDDYDSASEGELPDEGRARFAPRRSSAVAAPGEEPPQRGAVIGVVAAPKELQEPLAGSSSRTVFGAQGRPFRFGGPSDSPPPASAFSFGGPARRFHFDFGRPSGGVQERRADVPQLAEGPTSPSLRSEPCPAPQPAAFELSRPELFRFDSSPKEWRYACSSSSVKEPDHRRIVKPLHRRKK